MVFVLVFLSCAEESKVGKKEYTRKLTVKKNVKIPIDGDVHYKSWQIHIKDKGDTTYLVRKNYFKNQIIEYNWNTGKKVRTLTFKRKGPNKVKKFDSAGFIEIADSIYAIATGRSRLYIVKNDSVLLKNNYDDTGKGWGLIMNGFNKNLPVKVGDELFFFRNPPFDNLNPSQYYSSYLLVKYNVNTNSLQECSVKYPDAYKPDECWCFPQLRQSFTLNNKGELIFSFPIDSYLYRYVIEKDTLIKINKPLQSGFNAEFTPSECKELSPEKYHYSLKKSAVYEAIKYDPYRNLYYRIVLLPPDELTKKNAKQKDFYIAVMTLDADFNIIAEDMLPYNTYDYDDFFVTKEGFWLSRNNPNNPDFDENFMSFDLFTLTEK